MKAYHVAVIEHHIRVHMAENVLVHMQNQIRSSKSATRTSPEPDIYAK